MRRLPRSAAPCVGLGAGAGLGAGVGLRGAAEAAMATGDAAVLAAVQPAAARSATLLTVGGNGGRVLLAVLAGARDADKPAGVVARALAGTCTAVRVVAMR